MKPIIFSLVLTLIVCFIIYVNDTVLADKNNNKIENKLRNKINKLKEKNNVENLNFHKNQHHVHETNKNHIKTKQAIKLTELILSKQMADAKKKCWNIPRINQRIINGTESDSGSLPWMAVIFRTFMEMYSDTTFGCGGAIISSKFVLTAGHCVVNLTDNGYIINKPEELTVRYGMRDLSSKIFVKQLVDRIYPHPGYRSVNGTFNDIALIKLKQPVKYNDVVNPICIPNLTTPDNWNELIKRENVLISGWGDIAPTGKLYIPTPRISLTLQKSFSNILENSVCKNKMGNLYNHSTTICTGSKTASTCQGDSGSPLVPLVFTPKGGSTVFPVAIGVISLGTLFCRYPSIATKVESFAPWINQMTL